MANFRKDWISSRWKIRVRRMTKHFRPRSQSWKTRHILTLSLMGFLWYVMVSKWSPEKRASLIQTIQGLRFNRGSELRNSFVKDSRITAGKPPSQKTEDFNNIRKDEEKKEPVLVPSSNKKTVDQGDPDKPPVIIVWRAMEYQMKLYKVHLEYIMPPECGGCQVTTDRSHVATCAALVHFNAPDLNKIMDVPDPRLRNPNQIYVFWSRETPSKTYSYHESLQDPRFDPIFNLTMNFRVDSDIIDYFGNTQYELRFFWKKRKSGNWFKPMLRKKTGLIMWAVSNCNSTYGAGERMKYARSLLKAGLNLTTFGSCFDRRYTGSDILLEFQRHKFYLSLENSIHCPDYVSEKFWRNGLRAGAVPVVWGPTKDDVVQIAPHKSYIHSEDFDSPEDLVKYLNYLDKNDTAYREYHAWRDAKIDESIPDEDIAPNHRSSLCRLCKKVREKPLVHKTIPSVHDWLYNTRYADDLCFKS